MLYLTCGNAVIGETVQWSEGIKVDIKAVKLKKGHRAVVYNNDTVIYNYKAKSFGSTMLNLKCRKKVLCALRCFMNSNPYPKRFTEK